MFFGDSSGIYRAIVALKLLHLTRSRPGVFPDFVKEFLEYGYGLWRSLVKFLQVFLRVFGENDGVHISYR